MSARGGLTTRMVLLGAALAVVVGLAIGAMLLTIGDMRHAARMARHSEQVIASANRAEKQYELTRDARFLAPWRTAQTALPRQTEGSRRSSPTIPRRRPSSSRSPPGPAPTSTSTRLRSSTTSSTCSGFAERGRLPLERRRLVSPDASGPARGPRPR